MDVSSFNREDYFRISLMDLIIIGLIAAFIFIIPEIFHGGFDGIFILIFIVAYGLSVLSILITNINYRIKSRNKSDLLNDFIIKLKKDSILLNNEEYVCMICNQFFKQNQSVVSCLNCNCYFYLEHL